jgi:hypothetical protein
MKESIQIILAKGLLQMLSEDEGEIIHQLKDRKIIENGFIEPLQLVKDAIDNGLPLTLPIKFKNTESILLEHILYSDSSKEMIDYVCSKLTKEDVENMSVEMVNDIYKSADNNINLLERFFMLGFDFPQGKFEEYGKIISGDISFFELCLQMKPDFKFTFLYEDNLTLDELLIEEIADCKSHGHSANSIKNKESLYDFLKKVRQAEELRDELNINLTNNHNSYNPTRKI